MGQICELLETLVTSVITAVKVVISGVKKGIRRARPPSLDGSYFN
jgi:hypothetical protein